MIRTKTSTPRASAAPDGGSAAEDQLLAAVPPRSARRELWVGLFVILGLVSGLVALFTLTDAATFRGRYYVTTIVPDAGGLRRGDPVQLRGVNVGRVRRFEIVPEGVAIRLELEGEYEVPADSRVVLRSNGLLGGMVVEIIPGTSNERLREGRVLTGVTQAGLFDAAAGIGGRAEAVLASAQALLSENTVGALSESAQQLRTLLAELSALAAEQRRQLSALSGSLLRTAAGVERVTTGPELQRAAERMDSLTQRLDEATAALNRASSSLEVVLARLERGEGTLGLLSKDDSLYHNLNRAVENLSRLTEDFQKNPRRYINLEIF
jgi:phospholipid/cholesterol/gamma-HCH transport system substrate-binding protein